MTTEPNIEHHLLQDLRRQLEGRYGDHLIDVVPYGPTTTPASIINVLVVLRKPEENNPHSDQLEDVVIEDPARTQLTRSQVFISYSRKDKEWLIELQTHLKPYFRNTSLTVWDDTQIMGGTKWRHEIKRALASAKVAVLLVTPNYLASDFIAEDELPPLLKAAEKEGLTILWIPVSSSSYGVTEIAEYQAVIDPDRPLDSLPTYERNRILVGICETVIATLDA